MIIAYKKQLHNIVYLGKKVNKNTMSVFCELERIFDKYQWRWCDKTIPIDDLQIEDVGYGAIFYHLVSDIRAFRWSIQNVHTLVKKFVEQKEKTETVKRLIDKFDYSIVYTYNDYAGITEGYYITDNINCIQYYIGSDRFGKRFDFITPKKYLDYGQIIELTQEEYSKLYHFIRLKDIKEYEFASNLLFNLVTYYTKLKFL